MYGSYISVHFILQVTAGEGTTRKTGHEHVAPTIFQYPSSMRKSGGGSLQFQQMIPETTFILSKVQDISVQFDFKITVGEGTTKKKMTISMWLSQFFNQLFEYPSSMRISRDGSLQFQQMIPETTFILFKVQDISVKFDLKVTLEEITTTKK